MIFTSCVSLEIYVTKTDREKFNLSPGVAARTE